MRARRKERRRERRRERGRREIRPPQTKDGNGRNTI